MPMFTLWIGVALMAIYAGRVCGKSSLSSKRIYSEFREISNQGLTLDIPFNTSINEVLSKTQLCYVSDLFSLYSTVFCCVVLLCSVEFGCPRSNEECESGTSVLLESRELHLKAVYITDVFIWTICIRAELQLFECSLLLAGGRWTRTYACRVRLWRHKNEIFITSCTMCVSHTVQYISSLCAMTRKKTKFDTTLLRHLLFTSLGAPPGAVGPDVEPAHAGALSARLHDHQAGRNRQHHHLQCSRAAHARTAESPLPLPRLRAASCCTWLERRRN